MSLRVQNAPWFDADFHFRIAWYAEQGGNELAEQFVNAVETVVRKLAENPNIGWRPYARDSDLSDVHAILVEPPFRKHILFYRFTMVKLLLLPKRDNTLS